MDSNNKEEKTSKFSQNSSGIEANIERPKKGIKKYIPFIWEITKIAVIAFLIVAPIRYFLFQPFIVSGASMSPNFSSGDYLIVDEISYRFSDPQRGDVVVFNAGFIKGYAGQRFIKRIVGLPGEMVDVKNGQVQITKDGKTTVLNEKYLPDDLKTYGDRNITLKADEYFVLGDNRNYSYDSRMWGVAPRSDIVGKAFLRILPITSLSKIIRPAY
jgi:signal peptidase I